MEQSGETQATDEEDYTNVLVMLGFFLAVALGFAVYFWASSPKLGEFEHHPPGISERELDLLGIQEDGADGRIWENIDGAAGR